MDQNGLPASRFYMWRTVFALAHADGIVTEQEIDFLHQNTKDLPLSPAQQEMLSRDLKEEQDPAAMFAQVTDGKDREEFFTLARVLCWSDGDFDAQEKKVMDVLKDIQADREAQDLLKKSRTIIQEIELNKDQWDQDNDDKPLFGFLGNFIKKSA